MRRRVTHFVDGLSAASNIVLSLQVSPHDVISRLALLSASLEEVMFGKYTFYVVFDVTFERF